MAERDYNVAIRIDPLYIKAYISRGIFYYEQKKYNLAIRDWKKATSLGSKENLQPWIQKALREK
ncbi:hypothetical protein [Candidatus Uabimicrobium sp. HlEnr_7]|uniref:hypothetical protein n=1 Tax=Candidatus Uabimicrobium helgolandensis TaxID=3095367 RepID=UPI003558EDF8